MATASGSSRKAAKRRSVTRPKHTKPTGWRSIEDIPRLRGRERRAEEVFVDSYGAAEQMSSLEVYVSDALRMPFKAYWRKPGDAGKGERVTVLEAAESDNRQHARLKIQLGERTFVVRAEQLWAVKERSWNAIVLDDNREWYDGLADFDEYDEDGEYDEDDVY